MSPAKCFAHKTLIVFCRFEDDQEPGKRLVPPQLQVVQIQFVIRPGVVVHKGCMGHVSYLAIVVDQQLELWTLENEHASKFVARRAARLPEATCCWVVVPVAVARKVEDLMSKGKKAAATRVLNSSVVDWGRLLPEGAAELDAFS